MTIMQRAPPPPHPPSRISIAIGASLAAEVEDHRDMTELSELISRDD